MTLQIKQIKRKIRSIEGIDECVIKTGYEVWIHAILEKKANSEEVQDKIQSSKVSRIDVDSSYEIGGGILSSDREVLKIQVS